MLRFLQGVFQSMNLERKCLLFYGPALTLLMMITFWFVQLIAQSLVHGKVAQAALDYADAQLARHHWRMISKDKMNRSDWERTQNVLDSLDQKFLSNEYQYAVLQLPDTVPYEVPAAEIPMPGPEQELLERMRQDFRSRMTEFLRKEPLTPKQVPLPTDAGAINVDALAQVNLAGRPRTFRSLAGSNGQTHFYMPVFTSVSCMVCHSPVGKAFDLEGTTSPEERAASLPYRVARVSVPQKDTKLGATWIRAVVISMAMLIIFVMLVVLHKIIKYLVLRPLAHLREVSDAISRGNLELRAEIDTEDEFQDLAGAFNKMLGHLTDAQDRLHEVNRELDRRVDELAKVNLQLYEANRLKSDFLANMSHELRTPLNSILGFSDVLSDVRSLTDQQRRYAQNIQKSGRVLLEMINDILDLAKLDAGKMEIRATRVDLGHLVTAQCDMVRSLSEEKNISLHCEIPADLPTAFQDQNKFGQILNNLLSNAIKFTPEGGVITVSLRDLGEGNVQLSVSDTGIGIAQEDHRVIFEKFRQGQVVLGGDGMTRAYSGTGLGLSIVKELCELLGGSISFTSTVGQGSTFNVVLPWRLPAAEPTWPVISASPAGRVPSERPVSVANE